ncbi:MAG: NAD(P)H-dependent oxidoreductase [Candidatus Eisenbacteria bacterium]|uniref:NAD(P)H-dependent oxidoreductase n=1 Tax=Eiseniibacteriota bacterium TaxID=2212470 RepID=A0A9D6LC92_UNCEI|nr:NAD(P)H-dependent oxidoreductase [Candidatus Eisenbacteria bacterium]MBI3540059.1 NAD(P)H-dependent oxidoreductase [Candidatus Eisenbacteria bacterium]
MAEPLRILAFAGSLRRASFNRGLLRAAIEPPPEGAIVEVFDLAPIPLYNEDVRAQGYPPPVAAFRAAIAAAGALLIASPENNYSVPGVLKNAIDWASRPPDQPLRAKPVAIMGASNGGFGTVRGQAALRVVLQAVESYAMPKPELFVSRAQDLSDSDGNLTDAATREKVRAHVAALIAWAARLRAGV